MLVTLSPNRWTPLGDYCAWRAGATVAEQRQVIKMSRAVESHRCGLARQ